MIYKKHPAHHLGSMGFSKKLSTAAGKMFDQIQLLFMILKKKSQQTRNRRELSLTKQSYKQNRKCEEPIVAEKFLKKENQ